MKLPLHPGYHKCRCRKIQEEPPGCSCYEKKHISPSLICKKKSSQVMSHPWMATLRSSHINKDSVRPLFTNSRHKSSRVTQWLPECTSHPVVYDQICAIMGPLSYISTFYIIWQQCDNVCHNQSIWCFWCFYIIINLFCPCLWPVAGFLESESLAIELATDLCPDCASPRTSPGRASKRSLPPQLQQTETGICPWQLTRKVVSIQPLCQCQRTKSSKKRAKQETNCLTWSLDWKFWCDVNAQPLPIMGRKNTAPKLWD